MSLHFFKHAAKGLFKYTGRLRRRKSRWDQPSVIDFPVTSSIIEETMPSDK